MSSHSRTIGVAVGALLLGIVCTGCQSTAGKKNTIPSGPMLPPPAPPSPAAPVPAGPPGVLTPYQSGYTPTAPMVGKLAPKMELAWNIVSHQKNPIPVMSGKSVIGPDGSIVVGPYGQFNVSGMTLAQATQFLEMRLQQYVVNPRVQLQLASPAYPVGASWSTDAIPAGKVMQVSTSAPAGANENASAHDPKYSGPDWGQTTRPITSLPAAQPTTTAPASQKKRGPVMSFFFGSGN